MTLLTEDLTAGVSTGHVADHEMLHKIVNIGNRAVLAAAITAGDSTLTLEGAMDGIRAGTILVIQPDSTSCEVVQVASVASQTITIHPKMDVTATDISFDTTTDRISAVAARFYRALVGDTILVSGSASNNGLFVVDEVIKDTTASTGTYLGVTGDLTTTAAGASVRVRIYTRYAHAAGVTVYVLNEFRNIDAEWFGYRADGLTASATTNTTALNRALHAAYEFGIAPASGVPLRSCLVSVPGGTGYINGTLYGDRGTGLIGPGPADKARIQAASSFTFGSTSVYMINQCRDGRLVQISSLGVTDRFYLFYINLNGGAITGSNGILASIQQPIAWEDVRVEEFLGTGIHLTDTQQGHFRNLEVTGCGIGIHCYYASMLFFYSLNIESAGHISLASTYVRHFYTEDACKDIVIHDLHIEGHRTLSDSGGSPDYVVFDINNTEGFVIDGGLLSASNPTTTTMFKFTYAASSYGGCGYTLRELRTAAGTPAHTFVNDVTRGVTLNGWTDFSGGYCQEVVGLLQSTTTPAPTRIVLGRAGSVIRESMSYADASVWHDETPPTGKNITVLKAKAASGTAIIEARTGTSGTTPTIGFFGVSPATRPSAYTVTNGTTDRAYDADTVAVAELADIVATLIADLKLYGLLQ